MNITCSSCHSLFNSVFQDYLCTLRCCHSCLPFQGWFERVSSLDSFHCLRSLESTWNIFVNLVESISFRKSESLDCLSQRFHFLSWSISLVFFVDIHLVFSYLFFFQIDYNKQILLIEEIFNLQLYYESFWQWFLCKHNRVSSWECV